MHIFPNKFQLINVAYLSLEFFPKVLKPLFLPSRPETPVAP